MTDNEFIKLNRKIKNWRWFCDVNTTHFFIYCLLSANWKEGFFKDQKVERGQFIRTYANMSAESGLSIQNIRTAIKHLKLTEEITVKLTGNGRGATLLITVVKYDDYQQPNTKDNTFANNQLTTNQHESNNQSTQIEELKNIRTKELKKELSKDNSNKATSSLTVMIDEKIYTEALKTKIKEWLKYKSEKKQGYKKTGFNVFLSKVDKALEENDEDAVIECFDNAMSHNWSGVFFDKLQGSKKNTFNAEEFLRRFEDE